MKNKDTLNNELKKLQESGIQADRRHLKQNMYTQFADPFEFAREYVVNSFDAMATECIISGRETKDTVTITIRDNGNGMDFQRLQDYFKIFRSRKENADMAIGQFGVGKMSVAALPDLLKFAGITSTGKECWQFETDTLIEDRPITLEQIDTIPEPGTKFEITFKKTSSLADVINKITQILYKYVRHLDIDIYFDLPEIDKNHNPIRKILPKGNWHFEPENLSKTYNIGIDNTPVEIIMGIGSPEHEIYQNKVYINSNLNLISHGQKDIWHVPHLKIRVNSKIFKLTFGRHCLSNEYILTDMARVIRESILPNYFDFLINHFSEEFVINAPELVLKIEEMACRLISYKSGMHSWNAFPLFKLHNSSRLSFNELAEEVCKSGVLYIEAKECEGTDYSMFDGPVLKLEQPAGGLELIQNVFSAVTINLNQQDIIIEAPYRNDLILTPEEKHFEQFLVFIPKEEVINRIINGGKQEETTNYKPTREQIEQIEEAAGICEEAKTVERDFMSLKWKVNYLVERDGKTPCYSRKFLYHENKIVLNLYHPEIREFVELSCIDANLAAHWAMAMCLTDPKLIPHITPEAREDLLQIDAMGRLDNDFSEHTINTKTNNNKIMDFLRDSLQTPF